MSWEAGESWVQAGSELEQGEQAGRLEQTGVSWEAGESWEQAVSELEQGERAGRLERAGSKLE